MKIILYPILGEYTRQAINKQKLVVVVNVASSASSNDEFMSLECSSFKIDRKLYLLPPPSKKIKRSKILPSIHNLSFLNSFAQRHYKIYFFKNGHYRPPYVFVFSIPK